MKHIKLLFLLFISLLLSQSIFGQFTIQDLDNSALFSFSIMSDNKGYSVENVHMAKCDEWIKEAGDKFIIGLGDHVKINRPNPFLELIKEDSLWQNHFYPNVADGENEFWGKDQGDWGAGAPILDSVHLASKPNVELRNNGCEYYAIEEHSGIRTHIIQLHYSDTPDDPEIAFNESTRSYLFEVLNRIDKTDNDIIVVLAHNGAWVEQLDEDLQRTLLSKADLVLGATTHSYQKYNFLNNEVENGALALNSGSVGNSRDSGFLQVHVFENPTRMIIQYQKTSNEDRELQGNGLAHEKIINGKIKEIDWKYFTLCSEYWNVPLPFVAEKFNAISKKFDEYQVVLKPDKYKAEYWAGAPSVVVDNDGIFWMAARMRSPEYPRGLRGYEIRILRSEDGIQFDKYHSVFREEVPIQGFERPALLIDPVTEKFKLYACGPWNDKKWSIIKFDDVEDLKQLNPASARAVISPPLSRYSRDASVKEYKDPVIIFTDSTYHCFVIGYVRRNERIFHFTSQDGEEWKPVGDINDPVMDLSGWHNFFVRPASVLPLGVGYLFVYEGSSTQWYDPVYNIGTGLAYTFDLHNIQELTMESPLILSSTPGQFYTYRYSHWIWVDGEIWVYAEVANKNESHEIRLVKISF